MILISVWTDSRRRFVPYRFRSKDEAIDYIVRHDVYATAIAFEAEPTAKTKSLPVWSPDNEKQD